MNDIVDAYRRWEAGHNRDNYGCYDAFAAGAAWQREHMLAVLTAKAWTIPMWIESGPHDGEIDPDNFVEWLAKEFSEQSSTDTSS